MTLTRDVKSKPAGRRRHQAAGRSMIELLISLAIGAVVLGGVLVSMSGTGLSGRKLDNQAALAENGQVVLAVLAGQVRMAGYWQPDSEVASVDQPSNGQPMIRGCLNGFSAPAAAWADLACNSTSADTRDAVAVRYQAGETTTAMAFDCVGQDVTLLGLDQIADRFFIRTTGTPTGNPALYCQPSSGGEPEMLVDNVERLDLRYGVSPVTSSALGNRAFDAPALEGRTQRYLSADELSMDCSPGAMSAVSWCAVTAIRVCALMRSPVDAVTNTDVVGATYIDCDGQARTSTDRRVRRAVSTTISVRNRTATAS